MYVCVCACVYVSEHDNVSTVHSIELKIRMHITGHCRTNPIDFDEHLMNSFLTRLKKELLYIMAYGVETF